MIEGEVLLLEAVNPLCRQARIPGDGLRQAVVVEMEAFTAQGERGRNRCIRLVQRLRRSRRRFQHQEVQVSLRRPKIMKFRMQFGSRCAQPAAESEGQLRLTETEIGRA